MSDEASAEAEHALAAFRSEWRSELQASQQTARVPRDAPKDEPVASRVPFVPARPAKTALEVPETASAVQVYAAAIEAERSARLNEATVLYRRAFRLDPDVERAFHTYSAVQEEAPNDEVDDLAFTFARTVQLGEDYVDPKGDATTHPSSTSALKQRLQKSIDENPFSRPVKGKGDEDVELVPEKDQQAYHAANVNLPIHFARLPPECVVQILLHLVLPRDARFYPRIEALEAHFARLCRRGRLDSLEPAIWRSICERVYRWPQIPEGETTIRLIRKHGMDWRRMYLSQPRLRTDGCFIGVQRYVRRGHQESAWVSPSYSISQRRTVYADGRCVSLQTTVEPAEIVRQLQPNLRIAGLLTGQWALSLNGTLQCKLEDPAVPRDKRKYSFELEARLKSVHRGTMNKLEILRLATCRRETKEIEELPLGPDHGRPFFFSPVSSFEM